MAQRSPYAISNGSPNTKKYRDQVPLNAEKAHTLTFCYYPARVLFRRQNGFSTFPLICKKKADLAAAGFVSLRSGEGGKVVVLF
jgi:hypothetical protein